MIVTDDSGIAELCRSMRNQGRPIPRPGAAHAHTSTHASTHNAGAQHMGSWLAHERLGFNFRLSELNAALGVAQIERLDHILAARDKVAQQYLARLSGNDFATPIQVPQNARMSWFVFALRLADRFTQVDRDAIIADLRENGIGAADYFPCIHLQPFYQNLLECEPNRFPHAEALAQRSFAIPFHNRLTSSEIDRVVSTLERAVAKRSGQRKAA
jgi:perosamine synthetase